jgi:Flp pilus assembly protein CpaB
MQPRSPGPPERPAAGVAPPSPPAGRLGRAGRFNGRIALGVLLVLVAVIGGAVLLRRADATEPVLVAARDLSSGVQLQEGDLRVVRVRMPEAQLAAYARPGPGVVGSRLVAGVRKDGLVPVAFLSEGEAATDLVDYPIRVEPADVPDLRPGDRVAVVVSFDDGARRGQGAVLLPSVEVVRVLRGNASLGAGDRIEAVEIRVPKDRLALVAGAVAGGRVSMARLSPGDLGTPEADTGTGGATSTTAAPRAPARRGSGG